MVRVHIFTREYSLCIHMYSLKRRVSAIPKHVCTHIWRVYIYAYMYVFFVYVYSSLKRHVCTMPKDVSTYMYIWCVYVY